MVDESEWQSIPASNSVKVTTKAMNEDSVFRLAA